MKEDKIDEMVLKYKGLNQVIVNTVCGQQSCNLYDFVNQNIDGLLYDLNRDEATLLTLMKDEENVWAINDYALVLVIRYLKEKVDGYEKLYGLNAK